MNSELNHNPNHSDPDVLALLAMGDTVPEPDAQHAASCEACQREVAEMRRVVHLARAGTPGGFAEAPSTDVWSRISADLGLAGEIVPESIRRAGAAADGSSVADAAVAGMAVDDAASSASSAAGSASGPPAGSAGEQAESGAEPTALPRTEPEPAALSAHTAAPAVAPTVEPTPTPTDAFAGQPALHAVPRASDSPPLTGSERSHRHRGAAKRGRWIPLVAAAAAAVVVVVGGIAITTGLQQGPSVEVLAAAELDALPDWEGATGEAVVEVSDDGERNVVVTMATDGDVDGYREVWLISEDLSALVSIGVLEGEDGRFVIPEGIDLEDYPLVDVSDEPLDGNPDHSGNSIVRGTLES